MKLHCSHTDVTRQHLAKGANQEICIFDAVVLLKSTPQHVVFIRTVEALRLVLNTQIFSIWFVAQHSAHRSVYNVQHEPGWLTKVWHYTQQATSISLYVCRCEDSLSDSQAEVSSNTFTVCSSVDPQNHSFLKGVWLFYTWIHVSQ